MAHYISSKIMLAIVGLHGRHPRVVLLNRRVIHCHLLLHGLDVVYSAVGIFGSLTNLLRAHRTRRESLLVEAVFGLADRSLKHLAQRKGVRQERDGPLDGLLVLRVPEEVRQLWVGEARASGLQLNAIDAGRKYLAGDHPEKFKQTVRQILLFVERALREEG